MNRSDARTNALATVTLAVVSVATALSFCRVFGGWSFLVPLVTVALAGHAASTVGRVRRWRGVVATPTALVVVVVVVSWWQLPRTLAWGLPTPDTVTAMRELLPAAWRQLGVAVPPVGFAGGFALTAMLATGCAAVAADGLAFRTRARVEALLPAGIIFVTVSAIGHDRGRALVTASWLAAALLYVAASRSAAAAVDDGWIGRRRRGLSAWFVTGALVTAVVAPLAGVLGPRMPGADADPLLEPRARQAASGGDSLSLLVDIRGRLADRSDAVLFTVRADRPAYWRMASMSDFDGTVWSLSSDELLDAGGRLAAPQPFGEQLVQRVEIGRLTGNLVPVAASPTGLRSSDMDLFYVQDSGTLVVADPGLRPGDTYTIVSSTPRPPVAALATASSIALTRTEFTRLPPNWDPELTSLARSITAGQTSPYGQAIALQNWFRREFTYDLSVRLTSSVDAIEQFVRLRRGYCEQFAGTYAAFARSLGLPARVAVGFTPGERGGDGAYRVRSRHAHAWPEVWFDDIGWVSFEPTPGRGQPGAEEHTGVAPAQSGGVDDSTATTTAPAGGSSDPTTRTSAPRGGVDGSPNMPGTDTAGDSPLRWLVLVPVALGMWCLVMPAVVRRRTRPKDPDQQVVDDWNASITAMRLAGVPVDPSATPREAAAFLARHSGLDRHELLELATAATHALYGEQPLDPARRPRSVLIGRHVRDSATSVIPWSWKLRSRIDPRVAARLLRG